MYKKLYTFLKKIFRDDQLFKYGFNLSPMYRRSVGRIKFVSRDLLIVRIEIPLNYKNVNYAGSMFGGSMFSATDPIYMIQLIQILGDDYVVWDKSAFIDYKKPARSRVHVTFEFTADEIAHIKAEVTENGRLDLVKNNDILSAKGEIFAKLEKTIFIATKVYYKEYKASKEKSKALSKEDSSQ
ncbi:MAG: acyl-coenzyme A thioesterase PaaI-like protein [Crocinitomix sp.]|jgi:acyl-coenzyme A thioesterase PaaI-like protein